MLDMSGSYTYDRTERYKPKIKTSFPVDTASMVGRPRYWIERAVTKIEGDFEQEIGSDMRLFMPTPDATIPIIVAS